MAEPKHSVVEKSVPPWIVLVIEDNEQLRKDIVEEFDGEEMQGRELSVRPVESFDQALQEVAERRADLVILDVYRGDPLKGGEPLGFDVLATLRKVGFANVIIYTALPEGAKTYESPFVCVVGKDESGVAGLRPIVESLFARRLPHVFRAIVSHLDKTLRDYMWNFVERNWVTLEPISGRPEFLRLLLRRLAASLSREGIDSITAEAFNGEAEVDPLSEDQAHPAEYYVMPPVGADIRFGDVRLVRVTEDRDEHRVVVWPSCDLVTTSGRKVKADRIACALAIPLADTDEMRAWSVSPNDTTKRNAVGAILRNRRSAKGFSQDRFHYLPGFSWIPDLLVDFQDVERFHVEELSSAKCLGTIASPFAEYLASRYLRYIGRLGVPDLATETLLTRLASGFQRATEQ